jgi:large subunit ribosomal protein L29
MSTDYKSLGDAELVHGILAQERDLVGLRFKHSMNQLENTARLRVIRKAVARMRTELRTRERAAGLGKDELMAKHRAGAAGHSAVGADAAKGAFLSGVVDKLTSNS